MRFVLKTFFLLFVAVFSFKGLGQSVLTNSMVYDYNVGDTMQFHSSGNSCCFADILYNIISKSYSSNNDTVIYGVKINTRSFQSSMVIYSSPTITIGSSNASWKYYDLNMPFPAPTLSNSAYYQKDTLITAYCNKQTLKSQSYCYSNFECDGKIEEYSSGLGHTYSYAFYYQASLVTQGYIPAIQELTYYHKVGEPPCGTNHVALILDVNKNYLNTNNIILYPNPVLDKLNITSENIITSVEITDVYGKVFYFNAINNTINIEQLNTGMYFLKKINNNNISLKKIIKID